MRPALARAKKLLAKEAGKRHTAKTLVAMFTGTYTAIVTPFRDGQLDEPALARLVKNQVRGGVDGIVPVGTTGESPTLDFDEHIRVIELAVKAAAGKVTVMAGTGSNSTTEAIGLTLGAERVGADAALLVAPYYNKPTQEGLFQHFKAIANETKLPLVLYSIPGRCGIEIGVDTVKRLAAACKNIVGIKEAGGSCDRVSQLRAALGPKFTILSGDDSLTLPFMSVGANGVISVASNVIPREVSAMVRAFAAGDLKKATQLHTRYYPLFKDLFVETNPVPVKAALALRGELEAEYRLPLVELSAPSLAKLKATLKATGLL
jgi:4-hydroxy-tetrahydrodipicolinate synthase